MGSVRESMLMTNYNAAREFIYSNARVLEQRVFAVAFEGEDPGTVVAALTAYQNPDGGLGHGLEPDKRAPGSQPLDVEIAFGYLTAVEAPADDLVTSACDWLSSLADPSGGLTRIGAGS